MLSSTQNRCIIATALLILLSGCEMTMPTWQFSDNAEVAQNDVLQNDVPQNSESQTQNEVMMESSYEQHSTQGGDKPNKSEIEIAEMGNHPAMTQAVPEYVPVMPIPRTSFQPAFTHKALSDYSEQMAMNLLQKTKHITPNSRIAVASFVDFSQDLQSTSVLGNRLAESFITELQSYGLAIVDYKVLPAIQVTANGDLFFERSGPRGEMQFVLTGTLQRNERGVEVNARIVNIYDQVVVATTRGFIPHFVVSSLTPDYVLMGGR